MAVRRGSAAALLLACSCQIQDISAPTQILESFEDIERVDVAVRGGECRFTVANPEASELADHLETARSLGSRVQSEGLYRISFFDSSSSIARFTAGPDWVAPDYARTGRPWRFRQPAFSSLLGRLVRDRCAEPLAEVETEPAHCGPVSTGPVADPEEASSTCWMHADCRDYMHFVQEAVLGNWEIPGDAPRGSVELGFRISASGCLYGLRVYRTSSPALVRSLADAVERSSPLPPLSLDLQYVRDRSVRMMATFGVGDPEPPERAGDTPEPD